MNVEIRIIDTQKVTPEKPQKLIFHHNFFTLGSGAFRYPGHPERYRNIRRRPSCILPVRLEQSVWLPSV